MQPYIHISSPTIYKIDPPTEIIRRYGANIAHWGWVNLRQLSYACARAHHVTCTLMGVPKVPTIPWAVAETSGGLVKCFGPLMQKNHHMSEPLIHYTYVRCRQKEALEFEDFFLATPELPTDEDCMGEYIYVPAGWAVDVLKLVRKGVHTVSVLGGDQGSQWAPLMAHMNDGSVVSLRSVQSVI